LTDSFVVLCRDPLRDLPRWLAEHKSNPKTLGHTQPLTARIDDARAEDSSPGVAAADGFRRDALHQLRGGMDAQGQDRVSHGLPSQSRTGAGGDDELRSLRAAGEGASATGFGTTQPDLSAEFASEIATIASSYRARIAALRVSLPRGAIATAVHALRAEMKMAIRAVKERRKNSKRNAEAQHKAQARNRHIRSSPRGLG
jgi:hypothetical protein